MNYLNALLLLISFVFVGCTMTSQKHDNFSELQGRWINEEDSNWELTFVGNKVVDAYETEAEECAFSISKESCDKVYSSLEATFMKYSCEDDVCFEITSLTDTTFSYRETSTGHLQVFKKAS